MNAVCVYVTAARLVMQTEPLVDSKNTQNNSTTITGANSIAAAVTTSTTNDNYNNVQQKQKCRFLDLNRVLPQLRQLLTCVVCCRLLNDPYTPRDARCQHNVCRLCVRGQKSLRPACNKCKDCADFKSYNENKQLRCLMLCYKSLCEHMVSTALFQQLSKQKCSVPQISLSGGSPSIPLPQMSAQEFVVEGANYDDILNNFASDFLSPIVNLPRLQLTQTTSNAVTSNKTLLISNSAVPPTAKIAADSSSNNSLTTTTATNITTAPPLYIKREIVSPPLNKSSILLQQQQQHIKLEKPANTINMYAPTASSTTLATSTITSNKVTFKNLKTFMERACVNKNNNEASVLPLGTPTISYLGTNNPGIVVPIVSSANTTTAPLSIASAKLLNRQLMRARNALNTPTATLLPNVCSTGEVIKPLTFKLTVAAVSTAAPTNVSNSIVNTTNLPTTAMGLTQLNNPPSIKTVSNGSAMYSVLYTGIGNKITIKRKTDGESEDITQKKTGASAAITNATATNLGGAPFFYHPVANANKINITTSSTNSLNILTSTNTSTNATTSPTIYGINAAAALKRRGCRCGNATATPGKLTCCGQRCPCYVEAKSCINCKCRGCRNPHRPDGGKVRPIIPELACYELQMADESDSLSPQLIPVASVTTPTTATLATSITSTANPIILMANATGVSDTLMLNHTTTLKQQLQQQQVKQKFDDYEQHTKNQLSLQTNTISTTGPISPQQATIVVTAATSRTSALTTTVPSNTATLIPLRTLQQAHMLQQQQQQQQQHQHASTFATYGGQQQQTQQRNMNFHANQQTATNLLQRESVLIQNAAGKYQVVNVFTSTQLQAAAPIANLTSHTLHTLPTVQLATTHSSKSNVMNTNSQNNSNSNNNINGKNDAFLMPSAHVNNHVATSNTTTTLSQILLQQQQPITTPPPRHLMNNSLATPPGLSLQLQQQLKQSNIITVHPINNTSTNNNSNNNNSTMSLISPCNVSAAGTTITLSPLLMTPPAAYTPTEIFNNDGEEFMNLKNHAVANGTQIVSFSTAGLTKTTANVTTNLLTDGSAGLMLDPSDMCN